MCRHSCGVAQKQWDPGESKTGSSFTPALTLSANNSEVHRRQCHVDHPPPVDLQCTNATSLLTILPKVPQTDIPQIVTSHLRYPWLSHSMCWTQRLSTLLFPSCCEVIPWLEVTHVGRFILLNWVTIASLQRASCHTLAGPPQAGHSHAQRRMLNRILSPYMYYSVILCLSSTGFVCLLNYGINTH